MLGLDEANLLPKIMVDVVWRSEDLRSPQLSSQLLFPKAPKYIYIQSYTLSILAGTLKRLMY